MNLNFLQIFTEKKQNVDTYQKLDKKQIILKKIFCKKRINTSLVIRE